MTTENKRADAGPPDHHEATEVLPPYYCDFYPIKRQIDNKSIIPLRHQGKIVCYIVHDTFRGAFDGNGESFLLRPNVTAKSWLKLFDRDDPSLAIQESHYIAADDHRVDHFVFTEKNSRRVFRISRKDFCENMMSFRHRTGDQLAVPHSKFESFFEENDPDWKSGPVYL